jgi:hypothetical protein
MNGMISNQPSKRPRSTADVNIQIICLEMNSTDHLKGARVMNTDEASNVLEM